jgi:SAM-dependent methyltransferase
MPTLDTTYWNNRYLAGQTGWDLGRVSPPLKAYIDQLTNKSVSILIPGGGNSYEALYLLEKGFTNITVIDLAPAVIESLRAKAGMAYGKELKLITGDFFALEGQYDLILEQTFFCALDPSLRNDYVQQMKALLSGNGLLVGLLFNRDFDGGPPFGGNITEYRQLFAADFSIYTMEPCYNSITPRAGTELFIRMGVRD